MKEIPTFPIPDGIKVIVEQFCGCGDLAVVWELVRAELARGEENGSGRTRPPSDPHWWFLAYMLNHHKLTEHGPSVNYTSLTPAGKEALAFLNEHGANWQDGGKLGAYYEDTKGTTWGFPR
jgi:hypothetical protein